MAVNVRPDDKGKKTRSAPKDTGGASSSNKNGSGGSGGSGGGGYDPAKEQKKAERKAAKRYIEQADQLDGQIKALRLSLSSNFRKNLTQRLANLKLTAAQSDASLLADYGQRVGSLRNAEDDNERAQSDQTSAALTNRARERTNALSEAMSQGAGESDMLKSQLMSLRSWEANQSEVNRSYFDTLNSINASLTDLTVDTRTARVNNAAQLNANKDAAFTEYTNKRSETLTNLGNLYGQKAEYLGFANEQVPNKKTKVRQKRAGKKSDQLFTRASDANAKVWENPGVGKGLRNWQGAPAAEARINNGGIQMAASPTDIKKPEGATLRKW